LNTLWIEANPIDVNWQLEQYHFNNLGYRSFFVSKDNINPILDVTFDGVYIINGDIVSPTPLITIKLKDENTFLALNDTANFKIFIKDPNGVNKRIYFRGDNGEEQMRFYPAQLPKNSCRIEYKGNFKTDGIYELRVQATDMSDNVSGDNDYNIQFEVINKSTITEVLNYPNPFSTSTRFVFTLTGSELPSDFKIQILTISGKVVKEIFLEDLGTIRIGRNITEYAWDGTDNFGDRLANGVYLYRVVTKINGQDIEKRNTNADKYFHKGFGKMYLMR
ncbi:MAG: FlgD immunoglobulin-like domain containing protein, partial [Bacteroidia bacterium]